MKRYTVYVDENLQATDMGPYQREGLLTSLIILTKKNSFQFVMFNREKWSIPPFFYLCPAFVFLKKLHKHTARRKKNFDWKDFSC